MNKSTSTSAPTTSRADEVAAWLIDGHVAAAMDARDTAATLLDLGRYCEGLDYDRDAEHHQGMAWIANAVATPYRLAA
ncbi:hypothetical protein [Demequina oxidasica]|uniref:hypothetical protein n=1 Tax=Demequina oxidasica TaxID=676199 RepID=UPI0007819060|nr:hypothetical protein [Demequina oxidasica]